MTVRCLVVEDDSAFAENLVELLELAGYSSEQAHTASEARALARAHPFDMALVDLGLPDARGNDLVAELRAMTPSLQAIVLTGQPTIGSAQNAMRSGATAYLLKDGDPRELEAVIQRTAEQARLTRALRESEARYATLVERAPLGIALVRDGRYTFVNERFARIFGHPDASALLGTEASLDRGERDQVPLEETFTRSVRRRDGKTVDVMVTRARLEIEGHAAVQLIVRDVTDENRVARELDDARLQLEEKRRLAALGEMVAGIAHEVRNPLQGVSWGVNELRPHCKEGATKEALEKIAASTREIEAIVAEVLDYARPMKLERIPFPVADLLESTREDVAAQAEAAGVSLEVERDGVTQEAVLDALKIKQALVNLAHNAIEASSPGGRVRLQASGGTSSKDPLVLEVVDEGCGLPSELGERIYLPFVTTKVKGTGLGLAVVRRIVEAHGGAMRLEPRRPKGTVARIELPATIS
jgi:PAS domain S-box-containing protein